MSYSRASMRVGVLVVIGCAALVLTGTALAHAQMSPPVVVDKKSQVFTLAVPTEKEGATTTSIELTPPSGFAIDSFAASPGWTRKVQQTGSGEDTQIQKVTWSGGNTPHEEAATFEFLGSTDAAKTYSFSVRQVYSDGSVVDWTGPESSDSPAPTIESKSSLGGGGGNTLAIVALVLAAAAAVLAIAALVVRSGKRALT
jgi:uncharacterized protein YcnI